MADTFGAWLKEKRKASGMNRAELAEKSRVTRATISLYELDKVEQPRKSQIDKIAKALNVPVDEARRAAGYAAPESNDAHDILDEVRISFMHASSLTDEQKEEILRSVRRTVAGIKAEQGNEK